MAGVPDVWSKDGDKHPRNTKFSPYSSEKRTNVRPPPRNAQLQRPDFNGGDVLSTCFPLNILKSADEQSLVQNGKSGSHKYNSAKGEEVLGREHSNLIKMQGWDGRKQQPLPQKKLPGIGSIKYVHTNCIATDLPYWKNVEKEDPPVKTLFRAKKWVDSDERGCKRVSCVLECERIGSKGSRYCSCSSRRIGVTLVQRNKVIHSSQDGVCSCFNQKRLENLKLILGRQIVEVPGSDKSCISKSENGKGQIDCCVTNQNESYYLDPSRNRFSGGGSDMNEVRVATVRSSKCFYLRQSGGSSYVESQNRVMFKNSAYGDPNVAITHSPDTNCNFLALNGGRSCAKPALPETFVGTHAQSDNLGHFEMKRYQPIHIPVGTEQVSVMDHQFDKFGEPGQKATPQEFRGEGPLKVNKAVRLDNSIASEEKKEHRKVLDGLEVDTLAKANNILEKIACTLDQIKVLSQSALPQDSLKCSNKIAGEEFNRGDSVKEKMEELSGMDNVRLIDRANELKGAVNISTENDGIQLNQDEEMKVKNPANEETFLDKNWKDEEDENPMEKSPLKTPSSDDINAIPLKITKAVSAFKTVETNAVYSCQIYRTQELKGSQEAKKSHSIYFMSQTKVGGKSKAVDLPSKIPPEENLHHHDTPKGTGKELSSSPNKTNLHDDTDPPASSVFPRVKNLDNSPYEMIDQKKMTSVALQSVLKTALSSKPLPMKTILESCAKGDEREAEAMKINMATNRDQPSSPPRIVKLAQPKASYIKALKKEFQNLMDKPMIERLDRLIQPAERLLSPCISNSKPPVHPSRSPPPKTSGTPVRNRSADGASKRGPIDVSVKKPQLRPQTSPNKAGGEVVPKQWASGTPAELSLKRPHPEKCIGGAESTRPSMVSDAHKSPVRVSIRRPSQSANQEKESSQPEDATKAQMFSPAVLGGEGNSTRRTRHRPSSLPARLEQTASERTEPIGNLADGDERMIARKKSLTENVATEGMSLSQRIRARTCGRRTGMAFARRRRFATCCFPLFRDPEFVSADEFFGSKKPEGAGDPNQDQTINQFANGSVNVSLTLKNDSADSSQGKSEEVVVKSAKEANNQIIFNVYQVTPDKLASGVNNGPSKRKAQQREQDASTHRPVEGITEAPTAEQMEKRIGKPHAQVFGTPGKTDIRDSEPCSPLILTSIGDSGEAQSPRRHIEIPCLKRVGGLPCMKNNGSVEEPCGDRENVLLQPENPKCRKALYEEPQAPFEEVQVPILVGTVTCDCCGRDDSSEATRGFSHSSQTETRTVSSVPTLRSSRRTELCTRCRRSLGIPPNLRLHRGKPLSRPLMVTNPEDLRPSEMLHLLPRSDESSGEGLRLEQHLDGIPSLGSIKDWLRDSNVDVRRWSSELTFKVDVGTSVSGFHVAVPPAGGVRGNREGRGAVCATSVKATRKDVACATKRSSVTVIFQEICEVSADSPSDHRVFKKKKSSKSSSVKSSKKLAFVPNSPRRKILAMVVVYVCLYTFLGWVILLPTYYLK